MTEAVEPPRAGRFYCRLFVRSPGVSEGSGCAIQLKHLLAHDLNIVLGQDARGDIVSHLHTRRPDTKKSTIVLRSVNEVESAVRWAGDYLHAEAAERMKSKQPKRLRSIERSP